MSYSPVFEAALSDFLDKQFLGPVEIDTQAHDTSIKINAQAEEWCKAGIDLRGCAATTEDKFAVFQIQSLGLLMEAISYAVPDRRERRRN